MGARDGGRPHGELARLARGPRQRDDRGAQRVRDGREQPRLGAVPAHAAARLFLAQLRQPDHRRARRHRARADRQAAGVLSHLVPARQRGAADRRALRGAARARAGDETFRADSEAGANAAELLYRGADAGRRAHGDARAHRRQPAGHRALPHRRRQPSRISRDRHPGADPRRHPGRATAPRAGAEGSREQ